MDKGEHDMLGNFTYCNPTNLHFGPNAMDALAYVTYPTDSLITAS